LVRKEATDTTNNLGDRNHLASWAGPLNGSLLYAMAYPVLWIAIAALLNKSRIFIKV